MEKFQRSEHLHAEGNWRLPPKNSTRYAFNSTPQRDRPQSLIMFAVNQAPAVVVRNGIPFRQSARWEGEKAAAFASFFSPSMYFTEKVASTLFQPDSISGFHC